MLWSSIWGQQVGPEIDGTITFPYNNNKGFLGSGFTCLFNNNLYGLFSNLPLLYPAHIKNKTF